MTSAQVHTAGVSRKPILSGEFAVVGHIGGVVSTIGPSLMNAIQSAVQQEQEYLQQRMDEHPDWKLLSPGANVTLEDDQIVYGVSPEYEEDAMALEYGDPMKKVIATGLLRGTARRREEDLPHELMAQVSEEVERNA